MEGNALFSIQPCICLKSPLFSEFGMSCVFAAFLAAPALAHANSEQITVLELRKHDDLRSAAIQQLESEPLLVPNFLSFLEISIDARSGTCHRRIVPHSCSKLCINLCREKATNRPAVEVLVQREMLFLEWVLWRRWCVQWQQR